MSHLSTKLKNRTDKEELAQLARGQVATPCEPLMMTPRQGTPSEQ